MLGKNNQSLFGTQQKKLSQVIMMLIDVIIKCNILDYNELLISCNDVIYYAIHMLLAT